MSAGHLLSDGCLSTNQGRTTQKAPGCPSNCADKVSGTLWPHSGSQALRSWRVRMGWTIEEASAEGCSSWRPGVFLSMCTKREPQGDRGAGNKACPPQSHIVTAQPCSSPAHSVLLAAPSLHPSCSWGAAPMALCLFRCPHGIWDPPKSHSMGTERTQLMSRVGLWRVWGCSGTGGLHRG